MLLTRLLALPVAQMHVTVVEEARAGGMLQGLHRVKLEGEFDEAAERRRQGVGAAEEAVRRAAAEAEATSIAASAHEADGREQIVTTQQAEATEAAELTLMGKQGDRREAATASTLAEMPRATDVVLQANTLWDSQIPGDLHETVREAPFFDPWAPPSKPVSYALALLTSAPHRRPL